jgi:hypothetical protein
MRNIFSILFLFCSFSVFGQHYLSDFQGVYSGFLHLCGTQTPCDSIAFSIQIHPTESPFRYQQITTYTLPDGRKDAKNYVLELDKNDTTKTKYLLDELDGILIPETRIGNVFYSLYAVEKQYFQVKTSYFSDRIEFELVVYDETDAVNTHSEPDEMDQSFYVSGLPYVTVQKGIAYKQ